jgi:hypothetical protein
MPDQLFPSFGHGLVTFQLSFYQIPVSQTRAICCHSLRFAIRWPPISQRLSGQDAGIGVLGLAGQWTTITDHTGSYAMIKPGDESHLVRGPRQGSFCCRTRRLGKVRNPSISGAESANWFPVILRSGSPEANEQILGLSAVFLPQFGSKNSEYSIPIIEAFLCFFCFFIEPTLQF